MNRLLIALLAVPLMMGCAELTIDDNSLSIDYCTVDCNAPYVCASSGNVSFGTDTCAVVYDDLSGNPGSLEIAFMCEELEGHDMTLRLINGSETIEMTRTFDYGWCIFELDSLEDDSSMVMSGTVDSDESCNMWMFITASSASGCRGYWILN